MEFRKLTDSEIAVALETQIKSAVGYANSELSREREETQDFYQGKRPLPSSRGNSKYVSLDVWDAVEGLKSNLLETFSQGSKMVYFDNDEVVSAFCDATVFDENDGEALFDSVIHDGLLARTGLAKFSWEETTEEVEEEFEDLSLEDLDAVLSDDTVELDTLEMDEETQLFSGSLTRTINKSGIRLSAVAPEEFGISVGAKSIEDARLVYHRVKKSFSDLIKEGYPKEVLQEIESSHIEIDEATDPEVQARMQDLGAQGIDLEDDFQLQVRTIWVYECYIDMDIDGAGTTKLWKITKAGNTILDKEPVRKKPFLAFTPLTISHSFFGSNYAEKLKATQNAKTVLTRGILDHTVITNNPRFKVLTGSVPNPSELFDNRIGGVVNTTRQDGIMPLDQSPLNPFVFQTIQLLDTDMEDTTGVSRLSQGLNKDAVSKQNSQGLIQDLVSLSQVRQRVIARRFARQFVRELYWCIYNLARENIDWGVEVNVNGTVMSTIPSEWPTLQKSSIRLNLSPGQRETEAVKFLSLDERLASDPRLAGMYPHEKRYNLIKRAMEFGGITDVDNYLVPPERQAPQEPDPMAVMQMQMAQKQLELQERQQALAEAKFQHETGMDMNTFMLKRQEQLRKDYETGQQIGLRHKAQDHLEFVDKAELAIANKATDVRAIASPSGGRGGA